MGKRNAILTLTLFCLGLLWFFSLFFFVFFFKGKTDIENSGFCCYPNLVWLQLGKNPQAIYKTRRQQKRIRITVCCLETVIRKALLKESKRPSTTVLVLQSCPHQHVAKSRLWPKSFLAKPLKLVQVAVVSAVPNV